MRNNFSTVASEMHWCTFIIIPIFSIKGWMKERNKKKVFPLFKLCQDYNWFPLFIMGYIKKDNDYVLASLS